MDKEGTSSERAFFVGDVIVDSLVHFWAKAAESTVAEGLKRWCSPDLVLVHRGRDRDLGSPNVFAPEEEETSRQKVDLLMDMFGKQHGERWSPPRRFDGFMRLPGIECAWHAEYADSSYTRTLGLNA